MPIFDYECPDCNRTVEIFDHSSRKIKLVHMCEECHTTMNKVLSAPKGFKLLGQGFYRESENRPD